MVCLLGTTSFHSKIRDSCIFAQFFTVSQYWAVLVPFEKMQLPNMNVIREQLNVQLAGTPFSLKF